MAKSLLERVGNLFMIGPPGPRLDGNTKALLEVLKPGSVILFGRNIQTGDQTARLIEEITRFLGYKPLMAVDQEGGVVTRLAGEFTTAPGAMALGSTGNPEDAYEAARILGGEMKAVGFDWNLAPVVDINNNPLNPGIGIRSFGETPEAVLPFARSFMKGLRDSGILPCLKHFPGNGRVITDPHLGMPRLEVDREELFRTELAPFLRLDGPCWMPTHLYCPALQTREEPITVSREVLTDFIRGELQYDGALIADDMNMGGVARRYSVEETVIRAFRGGMDMLSICEGSESQMRAVRMLTETIEAEPEWEGRLSEAERRLDRLKQILSETTPKKLPEEVNAVGSAKNRRIMEEIAGRGLRVIRGMEGKLPLKRPDLLLCTPLSRLVLIEDKKGGIPRIVESCGRRFGVPPRPLNPSGPPAENELLAEAAGKRVVLFTENAHLNVGYRRMVEALAAAAEELLLIALRNPYDGEIAGVSHALCSFGYTETQQNALERLLLG